MQPFEYRSVGYWSEAANRTLTGGPEKVIFLFAVLTVPKWSVAPVECGRFVVQRSPRGRLGSVLDVRNLPYRLRAYFLLHIQMIKSLASHLNRIWRKPNLAN